MWQLALVLFTCGGLAACEKTFNNTRVCIRKTDRDTYCPVEKFFDEVDFKHYETNYHSELVVRNQKIPIIFENAIVDFPFGGLGLFGCDVEEIRPGAFKNFKQLVLIDLGSNKLTKIEGGVFNDLSKVKGIDLDFNDITTIHSNAFNNMPDLELLSLNFNKLVTWDKNWLIGSPVRKLRIIRNSLTTIPEEAFKYSQGMKENIKLIEFALNKIRNLHPKALKNMKELVKFDLSGNEIVNVPENLFKYTKIDTVDLSNNKILCSPIEIHSLGDILVDELILRENPITCACKESIINSKIIKNITKNFVLPEECINAQ